jgi:hypothetical protein
MPDDNTIVAIKKPLPKATPLMPGEEGSDEALVQTFNPLGFSPGPDTDDPDIKAAQNAYEAAQLKLKQVTQRKAMLKLVRQGDTLDPDKVAELCEKEPWKKGPVLEFNKGLMGFVPEKFEAAALEQPEGSAERTRLLSAFEKAKTIYWDQMKADMRRMCAQIQNDRSTTHKRSLHEPITANIYHMSRAMLESPVWNGPGGRLFWISHNLAPKFREIYGDDRMGSGPGYQQWSLKLTSDSPDEMPGEMKNPAPGNDPEPGP